MEIVLEQNTVKRLEFIIEQYKNNISASSIINEAVKRLYEYEFKFINQQRRDNGLEQLKEI